MTFRKVLKSLAAAAAGTLLCLVICLGCVLGANALVRAYPSPGTLVIVSLSLCFVWVFIRELRS